jgi:hypothetical protein
MCSPYFALGVDSDTPNKHSEGLYEIINKVTKSGKLFYSAIRTKHL